MIDYMLAHRWPSGQVLVRQFNVCSFEVLLASVLYKLACCALSFCWQSLAGNFIFAGVSRSAEIAEPKFVMVNVSSLKMGDETVQI
jgi:hypothetical protein